MELYKQDSFIPIYITRENDMYVGEFFLTKPFEEYEKDQINLVKNISWLDIKKLDGFIEEVKVIISSNKLLSNERIEKIAREVKARIEYINKLKQTRENNCNSEI